MHAEARPNPHLRLIGADTTDTGGLSRAEHAVARANREAAAISASDARWVFAQEVARCIEGGRAAILAPARRRRLVGLATRMGLRTFDASLVIAIVQDGARAGDRDIIGRIAMVSIPVARERHGLLVRAGFVVLLGAAIWAAAAAWISGT